MLAAYTFPVSDVTASWGWRAYSNVPPAQQFTPSGTFPEDSTNATTLPRHHRKIRTLDTSKLTSDDYLDFSSKVQPPVRVILRSADSPTYTSYFCTTEWSSRAYPPGTHGFMYYHAPANTSPLAGELRFRVTPSRDPASFATGSDLLTERGIAWRYPLYKIVRRPANYQPIAALLLQGGLVSQRTLDAVGAAVSESPLRTHDGPQSPESDGVAFLSDAPPPNMLLSSTPVLSAFGQEFHFHYAADWNCMCVMSKWEAILRQPRLSGISSFLVRVDGEHVQYSPFRGSVICCFERSTLPEHTGKRVVVIRIKRVVDEDPVRLTDTPAPTDGCLVPFEQLGPREGELVTVMSRGKVRPWAVDVDKERRWKNHGGRALRILFEKEALDRSRRESDV
ncbi:hypothetical protein LXA43DRAFT_306602 [Ganoderma leucocontextum]|nr:hypothetical protein LXA43DRAFT_306602 [Ganoderma leucocontextum]